MTASRRAFLMNASTLAAAGVAFAVLGPKAYADEVFEVTHTDAEWRKILSPDAYMVMRHEATERPGSSPLDAEERKGAYNCAGCDLALFSSATKFHSGTGWPSFWKPLDNAVRVKRDLSVGMDRTEVHCRRCGGHLGHVFPDGPPPTHQRYCMNGLSLKFVPGAA
ncbi:MAG TPA: peptide-methionine (R)-S-oxide reductase MsrB [Hyphomonadaceae bacterium]|nr:peptide-methionine (R)-S-oxide reductase MsrB [Hyphomonadaceae bacterium]